MVVNPTTWTETVTLVNGLVPNSDATPALPAGSYQFQASYNGDGNYKGSTSTPEPLTIQSHADLVLTKVADPSQVVIGNNFTYTLTVHNLGPDSATNVVVDDFLLQPGVLLVGPYIPSQGTFDPVAKVWNVGTVINGASATLMIGAQIQTLGPVVNSATAHADNSDPSTASAVVTGMRSADMITKQFFLDSFDPPAGNPPATDPAAAQLPRPVNSLGSGTGGVGAGPLFVRQSVGSAGMGGVFNSLGDGPTLLPGAALDGATPQFSAANSSGATSGALGPLYGNTLGGPADFAGLSAQGTLLDGAGSPADAAPDALTGREGDRQLVAGPGTVAPYLAADAIGAAGRVDVACQGAIDDELVAAFLTPGAGAEQR
jgi:uncharacterized repeat protein (TIGR01451 family)